MLTIKNVAEMLGSMGLNASYELKPWHRMRRTDFIEIKHYGEIYKYLKPGDLLKEELPKGWERAVNAASSHTFDHIQPDHQTVNT